MVCPFQYPRLVTPIRLMALRKMPAREAGGKTVYREYNSTISDSLTSLAISLRSGAALNVPSIFLLSTATQVGMPICSARDSASTIRTNFFAFSRTAITSPGLTWYDGMGAAGPGAGGAGGGAGGRPAARGGPNPGR